MRPFEILRGYRREYLRADLVAGLTVAVVLLPQAIAYALIAELPAEAGLYAAVIAGIAGALWGSSKHLQTGPTNAASLLVLTTLLPILPPGTPEYIAAASLMAIMVGAIRFSMGMLHLGILANFVSDSVIIGFTAGAGILISANQLRHLFGLSVPGSPYLFNTLQAVVLNLSHTHALSLILGLGTVMVVLLLKRFKPHWPSALISMALASVIVGVFHLEAQGVKVLGELPRSLPPLSDFSLFRTEWVGQMAVGAFAVAAIGLVEATSIARSIAAQSGQYVSSNQEFVGQGMANMAAGLFSGYTCSGSFIRSSLNYASGAKTQMASVFSGLIVLAAALAFAPLTAYLPRTALAGVLIVTAYGMIDRKEMRRIWNASRGDSLIMLATLGSTLVLPLQYAVLAGVIVSFVRYVIKTSTPLVYPVVPSDNFRHFVQHEDQPFCPQLGIITISGSLYFGAAHHVEKVIRAELDKYPEQTHLLLRMHLVDHCDVSGIHMLESLVRMRRKVGGDVFLSGVRPLVRQQMELLGFDKFLSSDHFFAREDAIAYLFHHVLSPEICIYECPVRVFAECQALPKYDYRSNLPVSFSFDEHHIDSLLPSELQSKLTENGQVLVLADVREEKEYQEGHISQACLIPMRHIAVKGKNLPRDCPIVLVCRTGRRSMLAAHILKDMGYSQVYNLEGGMLAWKAAGYPVAVE